jgi:hypothetical protein
MGFPNTICAAIHANPRAAETITARVAGNNRCLHFWVAWPDNLAHYALGSMEAESTSIETRKAPRRDV